jgi:hypothetical protein
MELHDEEAKRELILLSYSYVPNPVGHHSERSASGNWIASTLGSISDLGSSAIAAVGVASGE